MASRSARELAVEATQRALAYRVARDQVLEAHVNRVLRNTNEFIPAPFDRLTVADLVSQSRVNEIRCGRVRCIKESAPVCDASWEICVQRFTSSEQIGIVYDRVRRSIDAAVGAYRRHSKNFPLRFRCIGAMPRAAGEPRSWHIQAIDGASNEGNQVRFLLHLHIDDVWAAWLDEMGESPNKTVVRNRFMDFENYVLDKVFLEMTYERSADSWKADEDRGWFAGHEVSALLSSKARERRQLNKIMITLQHYTEPVLWVPVTYENRTDKTEYFEVVSDLYIQFATTSLSDSFLQDAMFYTATADNGFRICRRLQRGDWFPAWSRTLTEDEASRCLERCTYAGLVFPLASIYQKMYVVLPPRTRCEGIQGYCSLRFRGQLQQQLPVYVMKGPENAPSVELRYCAVRYAAGMVGLRY